MSVTSFRDALRDPLRIGHGTFIAGFAPYRYLPCMLDLTARFRELHASGCFVIPNPWDAGSARLLEQTGFHALGTTSSGFAWTLGHRDNQVTLEQALEHFRVISGAVTIPVSADFERGFAVSPADVAANVSAATATGIAGLSIEDSTGDPASPLFDFDLAVERVHAARAAIDATSMGLVLTARCEAFLAGKPDLTETIRRLRAYAGVGADCVYAPGMSDHQDIRALVEAVAPTPVNVLAGSDFATVEQLRALGVRRISVGGALARAAWTGFLDAAQEIAANGTFTALARAVPFASINGRFA
jgi:2-methylisocitrate lyase-like PEP mutase family enzyme